jgi:hypothetical protein
MLSKESVSSRYTTKDHISPSSLPITELGREDFAQIYSQIQEKPHKCVPIGRWVMAKESEVVVNRDAGPCIILYFHDKTKNLILSGHYPYTREEHADEVIRAQLERASAMLHELNPQGIKIPVDREFNNFRPPLGFSIENYNELMSEVKALIRDGSEMEVYIFGQNDTVSNPEEVDEGREYQQVLDKELLDIYTYRILPFVDLQGIGISSQLIHDFRPPISNGVPLLDHTMYIPGVGIVFTREEILENPASSV